MVNGSRKQKGAGCRLQKGAGCRLQKGAGCRLQKGAGCRLQKGAGYTFDLCKSDAVGGATRVKYDDVSPPELAGMSKCDSALGAIDTSGSCAGQVGGKRRRTRKNKRSGRKATRKTKRSGRKATRKSRGAGRRRSLNPLRFLRRLFSGKQKGGKFGCRQPEWDADCL